MRILRPLLLLAWLAPAAPLDAAAPAPPAGARLTFETHIRPILKVHCFHCHGDEDEKQGNLDLRLVRLMGSGGESGPALMPGKHQASLIYQRIAAGEMPPGEKKMPAAELALIARWIDGGAKTARPEPQQLADVTDDDREFWSFRPIVRPAVPAVKRRDQVRTPIDAFILARLEERGLGFSPEADPVTLCRRVYFDLLGLPPTMEEVEEFVASIKPRRLVAGDEDRDHRSPLDEDAYAALIDRLLDSPRYGERWARHWLDVAGYADSDGYADKDIERKFAYKYRDYIIRSLNADRPWDELIREQLAGDELTPAGYQNLTPEQADRLVATGFLRMGPDGTGDPAVDQNVARNDCVAEAIKIVTTSLLGLTVGCAQCHNHRYDPISQADYYRLRAVFEPAYDWKNWRAPAARLVSLWSSEQRALAAQCDAQIKQLGVERAAAYERLGNEVREKGMAGLDDSLKQALREAFKTPVAKRTAEQKALLEKYPQANVPNGGSLLERNARQEYKAIADQFDAQIAAVQARRPADDYAHCLTEIPGKAPPTYLFARGDFNQPKQTVEPGELAVLCDSNGGAIPADDPKLPTTGRRLAYARHLTSGKHPLVARVLVNRVWLHHFGKGIVGTPGDFGALGEQPSHPELLDWLADDFMRGGWTLKRLHRLIVTSSVYRQSSNADCGLRSADSQAATRHHNPQSAIANPQSIDPDNRLLWRMNLRRLEAETIRDAILSASGRLVHKLYGPPTPVAPDEAGQIIVGVDTRDTAGRPTGRKVPLYDDEFRRSIYVQVRRTMPLAMLDAFARRPPQCLTPPVRTNRDSQGRPSPTPLTENTRPVPLPAQTGGLSRALLGKCRFTQTEHIFSRGHALTPKARGITESCGWRIEKRRRTLGGNLLSPTGLHAQGVPTSCSRPSRFAGPVRVG